MQTKGEVRDDSQPADITVGHLKQAKVIQVATVREGRPWICSVYFVFDGKNLYWLSLPSRRHSQEIESDSRAAVAVAVKTDKPVVGIQAEGRAQIVNDSEEVKRVMRQYVDKYDIGGKFYDNFIAGKNEHALYCFTPETFVLFDELNFQGDQAHQEIKI